MTPTPVFYELLIRGDASGNIAGSHYQERAIYRDDAGNVLFERLLDPVPVAAADRVALAAVAGPVNRAAVAQVEALTGDLALARQTLGEVQESFVQRGLEDQATITALEKQVAALQVQVVALTAPAPEPNLLASLNAAFAEAVPETMRGAFAQPYAIVRILVQAGQIDMARAVIESVQVPEELVEAKSRLLAALGVDSTPQA